MINSFVFATHPKGSDNYYFYSAFAMCDMLKTLLCTNRNEEHVFSCILFHTLLAKEVVARIDPFNFESHSLLGSAILSKGRIYLKNNNVIFQIEAKKDNKQYCINLPGVSAVHKKFFGESEVSNDIFEWSYKKLCGLFKPEKFVPKKILYHERAASRLERCIISAQSQIDTRKRVLYEKNLKKSIKSVMEIQYFMRTQCSYHGVPWFDPYWRKTVEWVSAKRWLKECSENNMRAHVILDIICQHWADFRDRINLEKNREVISLAVNFQDFYRFRREFGHIMTTSPVLNMKKDMGEMSEVFDIGVIKL